MLNTHNLVSTNTNFFANTTPHELIKKYGSPLYVYNEDILRARCKELKGLVTYPNFSVNYSVKANGNLSLLKIAKDEDLNVDAMSPGEIYLEEMAGFKSEQILFISNNVSAEEMQYALNRNITISVDSLSQLEMLGKINQGGKVCVRFNPGVGAGHHEKVVTGGKKTKFGVEPTKIKEVKEILEKYNLHLTGINQHIGSLFMEGDKYIEGINSLLRIAMNFKDLDFIDLGGGFGIPYKKLDHQPRLDLKALGKKLDGVLYAFAKDYGKELLFKIEPGRYIVAECGLLIGTVHSIKTNYDIKYIGTDLGFNVLNRPIMYDSHHDIEIYRIAGKPSTKSEFVTIVGNICESGDIIAKERMLPEIYENDLLGILDAGAYGYCMASNYNNRLRPAEVLVTTNGESTLIRKRDTFESLVNNFIL
ncbi:MAG: diaminopimelate decarboxylase [Firmicutes bacterium HGW-Firmicutes-1]|jgi:diaminopimelate decarboxylase|nr:MAG: diaminopimelate decarboxylase [Firmicutes bacterium HGW-Firmicutes-1]